LRSGSQSKGPPEGVRLDHSGDLAAAGGAGGAGPTKLPAAAAAVACGERLPSELGERVLGGEAACWGECMRELVDRFAEQEGRWKHTPEAEAGRGAEILPWAHIMAVGEWRGWVGG
jgi:hypothetical protein